jgi:signal transduction histidine kinase
MISAAGTSTVAPVEILHDIAHELRQPLSAIESIAYYLSLVLPRDDEKIQEQLTRLQHMVEQSDWILGNGLHLADPAPIAPALISFEELLIEGVSSRTWAPAQAPRLELADDLPPVHVDPALGRALVSNLLLLFRQLAAESPPFVVRTAPRSGGDGIAFELETAVLGYRSENALGPGGNLSLAAARRIVEVHRGTLECLVDPITGIRVRVMLP